MRRIILGLLMLGGVALAAVPAHANFNLNLECGKSYAVEIHGTEPELTADQPLHYIVGVGQLTLGPQTPSGIGNGCSVTGGELIYNDNDVGTFSAGPAACYLGSSLLGGGIPCFDGGNHISGGRLVSAPNGGVTLSFTVGFGWVNGAPTTGTLPLSFNMQTNYGGTVIGNSVADPGPSPTSPPPGSPVLVITMQQQSTNVSLPVTGPGDQTGALPFVGHPPSPLGGTGGGGNGYGVAPYLGLSVSLFQGYGAPSTDPFSQPVQGSFGSTVSSLQIFSNGQAGGSASFSSNDNVGNTTGATNADCDTYVTQTGNFGDGASNDAAAIIHPSLTCVDAAALATFELSSVVWGVTDTSTYSIVTGLSAATLTSGLLIPAGLMSDATGFFSVPAGSVNNLVFQSITSVNNNTPTFPFVEFFSTTPAGCDVSIAMPTASATANGHTCTLKLQNLSNVDTNPVNAVVEGDSFPFSKYAFESCNCGGTSGTSVTSPLTITSSDCPLAGTTSYTVTCKN
jgi:hypothetical protein